MRALFLALILLPLFSNAQLYNCETVSNKYFKVSGWLNGDTVKLIFAKELKDHEGALKLYYGEYMWFNDTCDILHQKFIDCPVGETIHEGKNRARYAMNGFVIAIGSYIPALTEKAKAIGDKIGKVSVDMDGTACKVPLIKPYIQKVEDKGRIGKKRKTARC